MSVAAFAFGRLTQCPAIAFRWYAREFALPIRSDST